MGIVVDTNIAFSAILNSNSNISKIILQPKSKINFYSTNNLLNEFEDHKAKLKRISGYSESDFQRAKTLITNRIKFIHVELIPKHIYEKSLMFTRDVDIDDTEFVALTEHIKGKLWTGDKSSVKGLRKKKWEKVVTTTDLIQIGLRKKR